MLAPDAALAQGCLSSKEARSAVQNGQAVSLSKMVKQIQKATGGRNPADAAALQLGGRLVYLVKVLRPDGQVETLTVDAGERRYLRLLTVGEESGGCGCWSSRTMPI